MALKKLPIGIDDFEKIRKQNFYYVDKTGMIRDLLNNWGEINLFARPRRFGKSLNMSMLKHFFEVGTDRSLFEGLAISKEQELCEKYMGKFPVISLSLKTVSGIDFEDARMQLWSLIKAEAERFDYLQDSATLSKRDKQNMMELSMGKGNLAESIWLMSRILSREYKQKVIILIDEYDVPLQKANQNGYYKEMTTLISNLFSFSMKTNPYMEFAVVTGCLRIAKESIFTGFNNPKIHTIVDEQYDEYFGFSDEEVQEILKYYGRSEYYDKTKEWYDGYKFGNVFVYCPWDVINWCEQLVNTSNRLAQNFWANVSDNAIIRRFADLADGQTREQIEALLIGKSIRKKVRMELTYDEIDESIENLWSVLFMTGYLTQRSCDEEGYRELLIPNKEVQMIMREQISKWFTNLVKNDYDGLDRFCNAFVTGNARFIERYLNAYLSRMISIKDSQAQEGKKENFYHGMLLGMLGNKSPYWDVESNTERGEGYADISVMRYLDDYAFLIELKYATSESGLLKAAETAIEQIKDRNYEQYFINRRFSNIKSYGIAFYKKQCVVIMKE